MGGLIERIPMAVLAGLLVVIGFQLVRPADLRTARAHGDLPVYVATVVGVVAFGLLEGVLVGVAVSVALVVRRVVRTQVKVVRTPDVGPDVPHWTVVAVHLLVDFVDHAVSDHLQAWKRQHEASGGTVLLDELALAPRPTR